MTSAESATIAEIVAGAESAAADPAANRCSAVIAAQTVPPAPLRSCKRADMIGRNSIRPEHKRQVKRKKTSKAGAQDSAPVFLNTMRRAGPKRARPPHKISHMIYLGSTYPTSFKVGLYPSPAPAAPVFCP